MKTVGYKSGPQFIVSKLLPNIILMTGQHLVGGISQMCRNSGSSFNCLFYLFSSCCCMPDSHYNIISYTFFNEFYRPRPLRSYGDHFDPAIGTFLPVGEQFPVRGLDKLTGMSTPRTVFLRQEGTFQMYPTDALICFVICFTGFCYGR